MSKVQNNTQSIENKGIISKKSEDNLHNESTNLGAAKGAKTPPETPITETETETEPKSIICPIDIFPSKIQDIINEAHLTFGVPKDFYLSGVLAAVSTSIGNTFYVQAKNGEMQKASLYCCVVGASSTGKTPSLNWCLKPLAKIEHQNRKDYDEQTQQANDDDSENTTPKRKSTYLTNATTEALTERLSKNKEGLIYHVDELIRWLEDMNRYSKGGSDALTYMSFWNYGDVVSQERVTKSLYCENPFLTIVGGTQPKRLEAFTKNHATDNGFFHRILFSYPESQILDRNDNRMNECHYENYSKIIDGIYDCKRWIKTPITIQLSKDANSLFKEFCNNILRPNMRDNQDDNPLWSEYLGKLEQYCLRFSLIIQVLFTLEKDLPELQEVTEDSMEKAIKLTLYFKAMAAKVLKSLENPEEGLKGKNKGCYTVLHESGFNNYSFTEAVEYCKIKEISKSSVKRYLKNYEGIFHAKSKTGIYSLI
jgi:hypothetical protein